ncbi:MAG: DUF951 domain-containing protein [Lachnospiraceae bacterium]|nr:DUF951 domain-containing protein [Lachnospiraceae bacterium]
MDIKLHDMVKMKKAHPCGVNKWEVIRVGMDIKIKCTGCDHIVMLPRKKFEKSVKEILTSQGDSDE